MEYILYLDDYINLYLKEENKILKIKPYKDTLKNGKVKDNDKFSKIFQQIINKNQLNKGIFNNNILVILNKDYTKIDKLALLNLLEEINYKKIKFKYEYEFLEMRKNKLYLNYNDTYFSIYYLDELGKIKFNIYENNFINRNLIINILKCLNKKEIFIYGKKYEEVINILNKSKLNYYYFEESDNLILNLLKNNCQVKK